MEHCGKHCSYSFQVWLSEAPLDHEIQVTTFLPLKQVASSLKNFINVCHTLSVRHKQFQCYLQTDESLFDARLEVGHSKIFV